MKNLLIILLTVFSLSAKAQDTTNVKIIIVKWSDVISSDSGWHTVDEAKEFVETRSSVVTQVGFLLRKDDKYLVMTESYFEGTDTIGGIIRIPVSLIITIREVEIEWIDLKK
jgi:hypothetical protein